MPLITIPKGIKAKLGDEASEELVDLFNRFEEKQKEDIIQLSAEKFERRLTEEISKVNERITELKAYMAGQISNLETKMAGNKADLIKWMFLFWISQIGVIMALLFAFFKR